LLGRPSSKVVSAVDTSPATGPLPRLAGCGGRRPRPVRVPARRRATASRASLVGAADGPPSRQRRTTNGPARRRRGSTSLAGLAPKRWLEPRRRCPPPSAANRDTRPALPAYGAPGASRTRFGPDVRGSRPATPRPGAGPTGERKWFRVASRAGRVAWSLLTR